MGEAKGLIVVLKNSGAEVDDSVFAVEEPLVCVVCAVEGDLGEV